MTILLDTSVIIDCLRFRHERREFLTRQAQAGDRFACSVISIAEVYAGMRDNERQVTEDFLNDLESIEVTQEIARRAGSLKYEWKRKGKTIEITDAIIAAVALGLDLTLATDNRKDFPMPQLRFVELPSE